jgi:hypothetical protein
MRDNEVVDLLRNAWSEGSIEDPSIGLSAIVPSKQITLDLTYVRNSWPKSGLDPEGIADGSRGFDR